MSFDLFAQQQQLLDRLATIGSAIAIDDAFTRVDLTDDGAAEVGAHLAFDGFDAVEQVGKSALHHALWSFNVLVDIPRATAPDKQAAADLFSAALAALIGWEPSPGRELRTAPGRESSYDGRVMQISFGFTVPVYLAG